MKAFWMSMILSSVSALGPSCVQAKSYLCAPLFGSEFSHDARVEVEERALLGPKPAEYAQTLMKIDSLLGNLEIPTAARIVVHELMPFSNFNSQDFTVYVGLRPATRGSTHPQINMTTLAHEYGHAIFEKNLQVQVSEFKRFTSQIESRSDDSAASYILYTGLHEFFADAVTLVTTKNPEALADLLSTRRKSLYHLKKDHEIRKRTEDPDDLPAEPLQPESFTQPYSLHDFSIRSLSTGSNRKAHAKWQALLEQTSGLEDPYLILMPARWHLWQLVKNRIEAPRYRQEILSKLFPLVKAEVDALIAKPSTPLSRSEIELLNVRLMRKMDDVLN